MLRPPPRSTRTSTPLPTRRSSDLICPYGLYAEQLSGTAFTAPRTENRRSWLYRIRPAAAGQNRFSPYEGHGWDSHFDNTPTPPEPLRWSPLTPPKAQIGRASCRERVCQYV